MIRLWYIYKSRRISNGAVVPERRIMHIIGNKLGMHSVLISLTWLPELLLADLHRGRLT